MWIKALALAGLAGLAALINLLAPTVFLDLQLMLGTAVAVMALLLFGWWGLVVGLAALAVTVWRWGHPMALLIGLLHLIWLRWFLDRYNGGPDQQGNGRIVLASIAFWLLIGSPAVALSTELMGRGELPGLVLAAKEGVTAGLSTALGLGAWLIWRAWRGRRQPGRLSARGLTFAVVVLAVSLPAIFSLIGLSHQLQTAVFTGQRQRLDLVADLVAMQVRAGGQLPGSGMPDGLAARWTTPDGQQGSTDPALFARLERDFSEREVHSLKSPDLALLVPRAVRRPGLAIRRGYWLAGSGSSSVVQPTGALLTRLDRELVLPCFTQLGVILLLAAALAELLASAVDRQLARILRPLQERPDRGQGLVLGSSAISELQQLVLLVNERARRSLELRQSLLRAQDDLAQTALAITEAIPVGTYTTLQRPGEQQARFSFLSDRFLEICGLNRRNLQGAHVHEVFRHLLPEDQSTFLRLEQETTRLKIPFKGQGRMRVRGRVRWLRAESVPRDLPDGSTIWEGALTDVTEELETRQRLESQQQQLRRILDFLPVPIGINRLEGPQEILFQNRRFRETFGYTIEEVPDVQTWAQVAYDDPDYLVPMLEQWNEGVGTLVSGGTMPPMEVSLLCRDRSRREVILSATRLDDLMLCTFLDVTESKRAAADLEQVLRRESQLKERQRRELEAKLRTSLAAAAVAHEINQPLSAILINTQMLQAELGPLGEGDQLPRLRGLLELQLRETERVVETIERMRMLLRNVRTDQQRIDFSEVVESARLYLAGLLSSHAVTVESSGLDQHRWLLGDGAQLQIAVANLIRNAVEATGPAAVDPPRLRLSLERCGAGGADDWLELRIADNGPGFADLERDHLLLASTKAGGSGIGLFVAASAVENHGGSISFGRSADLGGAEVLVRLPALPDP